MSTPARTIDASSPETVHAPLGTYSHTVRVPPGAEWLVLAGQVGIDPGGRIAEGFGGQTAQALRNILACLGAHGMAAEHLVKLTIYLTDPRGIEDMRAARREVLGESVLPASTLVIIDGLVAPELLVEIDAWAAKA